jgi:hypothetical protein
VRRRAVTPSSDPGLVELEFARVAEALGIPKSKRKAKFRQASRFAALVEEAVSNVEQSERVRILDLACGRSYLGMELVRFLARDGRAVSLHGIDRDPKLVAKCGEITKSLGWPDTSFDTADLRSYSIGPDEYDVVVSLHACDTLSDEAIRIACEGRVPLAFLAPCCQHELRHQWKDHPLEWIARYGLLEQRLADVLTDGLRCLAMEAMGYQVNVLRFVEPEVTPKNILIQGRLVSGPRPARVREARDFMQMFHVHPRLAAFLDRARSA